MHGWENSDASELAMLCNCFRTSLILTISASSLDMSSLMTIISKAVSGVDDLLVVHGSRLWVSSPRQSCPLFLILQF